MRAKPTSAKEPVVEEPVVEEPDKKTYNIRLTRKMIADLEDLRGKLEGIRVLNNVFMGLEELGQPLSRANVLRSVIQRGIDATRKLVQPPPEHPLVPRQSGSDPSNHDTR